MATLMTTMTTAWKQRLGWLKIVARVLVTIAVATHESIATLLHRLGMSRPNNKMWESRSYMWLQFQCTNEKKREKTKNVERIKRQKTHQTRHHFAAKSIQAMRTQTQTNTNTNKHKHKQKQKRKYDQSITTDKLTTNEPREDSFERVWLVSWQPPTRPRAFVADSLVFPLMAFAAQSKFQQGKT
jgi:hypothetical protein